MSSVRATALFIALFGLGTTGCHTGPAPSGKDPQAMSMFDVNMYALNSLVCNPMDTDPSEDFTRGLKAQLYYLKEGQSRFYTVGEYIQLGRKSTQNLFFSQLNVATRLFDQGFPTESGGYVKDDSGEKLVEFFALRFSSILKLDANQPEGEYELALLSDDGAIFRVREDDGVYREYVNNDGDHPTRLGCGTKTLTMNHDSEHVIQIDYYQGPRYHISLIPLWRPLTENTPNETLCGREGNDFYFDYNNQAPKKAYKDLLARGWRPIGANNYHVPEGAAFNPCVNYNAPQMLNLNVEENGDGGLVITWETNIPAASQVLYKNLTTGEETLTKSDNVLRTHHGFLIPLPPPGQHLSIRAISFSETFGKAISPEIIW